MKKILRKIMAVASMAAVLGGFVSCGGGEDPDYVEPVDSIWEGATILEKPADVKTSWGEEINIPKDYASRLQVGSKVIFEIDINGEYAKFMVASGWSDCNVEEYYNQKGTKLPVKENADHPGVYETLNGAAEKGIYYFVVTEESLKILKNGFGIRGNFILKKIGITNLGDPVADPDDDIELTEPEAKDGYFTFWAQSSGAAEGSVELVLNYEETTLNKSVTLSNVDIEYIINDGEAKHYTKNITLPKNSYGTDYQAKVPLFADYKVTKNDAIYIKITANVDDEKAVNIIQGNLIDTDPSVSYWKEMCIEEQQKQILTGITYAESSDPAEDERPAIGTTVYTAAGDDLTISIPQNIWGDPAVSHGIQFAPAGSKYLPEGAKAGEAYTITMKGTANEAFEANIQFLTAEWSGFGEAINANFTADGFVITGEYTFGSDTADDFMFVIGNNDAECTAKTLTLTEFTITRTK
ncbi:hypothetical protein DYE49_11080 [Treponema rectale]|uniref:Uncharacterized protein n=1 Tax=Treponema rectale TaxID=744512 RepID=A0A840SIC3_9SPIR|nr:hypothetical protein [Treponema rectale]MBB5219142.1 hypothetical protein [Treponema rectale]QOS40959.1 hypothetical protein DYE49_11080 [Treponema rectale]